MTLLKKWFFLGLLIFLMLSVISLGTRVFNINREYDQKERLLKSKKEEMTKVVSLSEYLKSDAFMEKEIRNKLGYTKGGEVLLILPPDEILLKLVNLNWELTGDIQKPTHNWKKWYVTFFEKS